jgi:ribosomal protein S27AE
MDKKTFEQVDPLVDVVAEQVTDLIDGDQLATIKQKMAAISRCLCDDFSVSLEINLRVTDPEGLTLPLMQTGMSTFAGRVPHQVWGDCTPQRYVVHGDVVIVPNDHCPQCWGEWGFKDRNPECPECGVRIGDQVKLLLDTDGCPHCENGTVTASHPKCAECGFAVNPDHVIWG